MADIEQAIQSSYPFRVSDLQSDFGEMVDSVSYLKTYNIEFNGNESFTFQRCGWKFSRPFICNQYVIS